MDDVETMIALLPDARDISKSNAKEISDLLDAIQALTDEQFDMLEQETREKYMAVIKAYQKALLHDEQLDVGVTPSDSTQLEFGTSLNVVRMDNDEALEAARNAVIRSNMQNKTVLSIFALTLTYGEHFVFAFDSYN